MVGFVQDEQGPGAEFAEDVPQPGGIDLIGQQVMRNDKNASPSSRGSRRNPATGASPLPAPGR